jgi:hypothetical protein
MREPVVRVKTVLWGPSQLIIHKYTLRSAMQRSFVVDMKEKEPLAGCVLYAIRGTVAFLRSLRVHLMSKIFETLLRQPSALRKYSLKYIPRAHPFGIVEYLSKSGYGL